MSQTDTAQPDDPVEIAARLQAELPEVLRVGAGEPGPMQELLGIMAQFLGGRADHIDAVARRVDLARAADEDLPWLAGWLGWGWLFREPGDPRRTLSPEAAFPPGLDRLRALLAAVPALSPLRGQAAGLRATLQIATGLPEVVLTQDVARQHLQLRLPGLPAAWRPWARRMVAAECPAHLTWSVDWGTDEGEAAP